MEIVKQGRSDSVDTFVRQAGGKEPYRTLSRPDNGPVQLFQLLHAIDQPGGAELPGWPLLAPLKVQMQKCNTNKCSREFCSPINYRRHIRAHRLLRKLEKDSGKDRDLLAAFWDNLSKDEVKEIVSFKDVNLEEIQGSSVIMALATLLQRPGLYALPDYYVAAGSRLLEIIQGTPSISAEELFSILDNASEKTFLCSAAASMQKYVFDGEIGKSALEAKNVVACASFLLEQKLVKVWLANKDAEALRCQKKLVEEEEAAQRRQEELLERKRRRKLRQKEQRARNQRNGYNEEKIKESGSGTSEELQHEAEPPSLLSSASYSDSHQLYSPAAEDSSALEIVVVSNADESTNYGADDNFAYNNGQDNEQNVERRAGRRHSVGSMWQISSKTRGVPNGFHSSSGFHALKLGGMQKNGIYREVRTPSSTSTTKIWSRKRENPKSVSHDEPVMQLDQRKNSEVLIGSISVALGRYRTEGSDNRDNLVEADEAPNVQHKSGLEQSTVKQWRPVSRQGSQGSIPVKNNDREVKTDLTAGKNIDAKETPIIEHQKDEIRHTLLLQENGLHQGSLQFSCQDAKAFLEQRWKEATAAEHVTLVLSSEAENVHQKRGNLGSSNVGLAKFKFRMKPEKGAKVKYVPKQRSGK